MDADLIARIQKLKKQAADANEKVTRLRGRKEQLLAQLQNEFGCGSIEEAQQKLTIIKKDIEKRTERSERLLAELEDLANG